MCLKLSFHLSSSSKVPSKKTLSICLPMLEFGESVCNFAVPIPILYSMYTNFCYTLISNFLRNVIRSREVTHKNKCIHFLQFLVLLLVATEFAINKKWLGSQTWENISRLSSKDNNSFCYLSCLWWPFLHVRLVAKFICVWFHKPSLSSFHSIGMKDKTCTNSPLISLRKFGLSFVEQEASLTIDLQVFTFRDQGRDCNFRAWHWKKNQAVSQEKKV